MPKDQDLLSALRELEGKATGKDKETLKAVRRAIGEIDCTVERTIGGRRYRFQSTEQAGRVEATHARKQAKGAKHAL